MIRRLFPSLLACTAAACSQPGGAPDADRGGAAKATKAGAAPAATGAVTQCPQSLGGTEARDRVISRDCGVVPVTEDYSVEGGSLTLEAGASLSFKDGAALIVGASAPGRLIVQGTAEAPVVLTSSGDRAPGVWRGVRLHAQASRSSLAGLVIEFAGAGDEPALRVEAADVSLTGSTIREARGAAVAVGDAASLAAFTGNEFRKLGTPGAVEVPPAALAQLGPGNRFDGGAYVQVRGGAVRRSGAWQHPGAPLVFGGEVFVDGEAGQRASVELAAGLELRFTDTGALTVGDADDAGLTVKGSAEAPVTFTAQGSRRPGGWGGLVVRARGEAAVEHAVFEFAGKDERGAIDLQGGTLAVRSTTFRSDRVGVRADEAAKISAFADNKFAATPVAVAVPANLLGALGEGNAYDREAKISSAGGTVRGKTTWLAQGAAYHLHGEVFVDGGDLTIEAGTAVLASPEAQITVGAYDAASLRVAGTAQAPVTIAPSDPARLTWRGLVLQAQARGSSLEHLVLTGASNERAIDVRAAADATLSDVTCSKCRGAVVGWDCGAKVSSSQVLAADGTPAIDARPEGC